MPSMYLPIDEASVKVKHLGPYISGSGLIMAVALVMLCLCHKIGALFVLHNLSMFFGKTTSW